MNHSLFIVFLDLLLIFLELYLYVSFYIEMCYKFSESNILVVMVVYTLQ